MVQVSAEVLITLGVAAAAFAVGIGKIMFDVGQIRGSLETRLDVHEKQIATHGVRIGKLESQKS